MHSLINKVSSVITRHKMIDGDEAVLVGVSGGPDSIALLHLLRTLAPGRGWRLGVAHLNHGLRPGAAESDEAFVRREASAMDLPYYTEKADVTAYRKSHGLSVEEAAREVRYRFLGRVATARGYSVIALGHHADDNGELVLMNLLRGSGPLGLTGMPPSRRFEMDDGPEGRIRLIRPLIGIRREDIEEYLDENSIPSVTDKSNTDLRYRRNRIRRELLPLLRRQYNPNVVDTLNRLAAILRSEEEWAESLSTPVFEAAILSETAGRIVLSVPEVRSAHPALQRRIIRQAIRKVKGNLRRISFRHIDAVMVLAGQPASPARLDLPDRIRVEAADNRFMFQKAPRPLRELRTQIHRDKPEYFEYVLPAPGSTSIPELTMEVRAEILPTDMPADFRSTGHRIAFFDMGTVSFPLTIRSIKPGDRFTPLGMAGTQKVKKFFIDHKIPASQRSRCPVLISRGKIVWLMGYRMDDSAKITPTTRKVLRVEFRLA